MDVRNPSRDGDRHAVVALVLTRPQDPAVLAIVRILRGRHGGQIALPGGHTEPVDRSAWDTARRELIEETGFTGALEQIGSLGEFNTHESRFRVDVEVACAVPSAPWTLQADEVTGLLEIPLRVLQTHHGLMPRVDDVWHLPIECGYEIDPAAHLVAGDRPSKGKGQTMKREDRVIEMPWVWGLTARILYAFMTNVWEEQ